VFHIIIQMEYFDVDEVGIIRYYDSNHRLHREDGPAFIDDDIEFWFYHGRLVECSSQKDFKRLLKLKAFW
jgi:hypothetical protein